MSVLHTLVSLPVAVWTVALGIALVYWLFVIAGVVDLGEGGDGAIEGAAKGAAEAIGHGLDGAADGADGAFEHADAGDAGGDGAHGGQSGGLASSLGAMNLRKVPATLSISMLIFFSWAGALALTAIVDALLTGTALTAAHWICTLGVAPLCALPLAGIAVRPIAPLFAHRLAKSHHDLIGRTCTVRTGEVNQKFGEAVVEEMGAELVLRVRVDGAPLKRGEEGLIIGWDAEREEYLVEALDESLRTKQQLR
jgi:hypothetical protein